MSHYFISDLHLQASRPDITEAFYHFVESRARDAKALYILGDFFDAWIGDDEDQPFYLQIKAKLREYSTRGLRLFFIHGNRDFLLGKTFATDVGLTLLPESVVIKPFGQALLLMHGDSLCTRDAAYMQFRAQVRNAAWQQQILSLSLTERRHMAEQMRATSQSVNSNKAEDIMDVTPSEVERCMAEHQVLCMVHGHTHRPNVHELSINDHPAKRVVLGDWENKVHYARADEQGIELLSFDLRSAS